MGITIRKLKPSQINARIRKRLGWKNSLGVLPAEWNGKFFPFQPVDELDFDPAFQSRFEADEFEKGIVTFLHESETFCWNGEWKVANRSTLWNFNLHYFEYLMSYVKAYRETKNSKYLDAVKTCISGWIEHNPIQSGGNGWAPYTISLRLVYWLSCLFYLFDQLDEDFTKRVIASAYEQYVYLAGHLEKDLLANHYFENLKTLILCSLFFGDDKMLEKSVKEFKKQCKEQILSDGMHFELSPMYHKIILEDVLRTATALWNADKADTEIESYIKPMIDVAYTFEAGLERVPLFNDGGNNVAKSLDALLLSAKNHYDITPDYKPHLPDSGYYFFKWNDWKLIVDAGLPGPRYNGGHAHCDAGSYELFFKGMPVVVNCGTYAYQNTDRGAFRKTKSHNTVLANNVEQSQCWGGFRLGKSCCTNVLDIRDDYISIEITDQAKQKILRQITILSDGVFVDDKSIGNTLTSYIHFADDECIIDSASGETCNVFMPYAEDFGEKKAIQSTSIDGENEVKYIIKKKNNETCGKKQKTGRKEIQKGYKPLTQIEGVEYFYKNGEIWYMHGEWMEPVLTIKKTNWKDHHRVTTRLFRREARVLVPLSSKAMLLAIDHKVYYVDCTIRECGIIDSSREHFSDPLNICPCDQKSKWLAVWGEYGTNKEHDHVYIRGLNKNMKVEDVYCFPSGQIKHIHNIVKCLKGGFYILTGDHEEMAGIYKADDNFSHVTPVAVGQQKYRAVVGFDTPQGLLYATDAVNDENYVYLLSELGGEEQKIVTLNGSCVYGRRIPQGFLFSTVVEPDDSITGIISWFTKKRGRGILSNEAELVFVSNSFDSKSIMKMEKDRYPMKLMQFGSIQFDQGNNERVWIYPVAVKKYDGYPICLEGNEM